MTAHVNPLRRLLPPLPFPPSPFSSFTPSRITMFRDGGTIKVDGHLNRSVSAKIRYDGGLASPTRGQFFVATKHFLGKESAERPMTADELRGLHAAIRRYVTQNPDHDATYDILLTNIRTALTGMKKVDPAKIPTSITGPNASASVEAGLWVDLMPGPGPRDRSVHGSVTIEGVGFNDVPPSFQVDTIEVYEKDTGRLVHSQKAGQPYEIRGQWGETRQSYAFDLPAGKADLSKQYTVVLKAQINGAKAQQVRSEYINIGRVY